MTGRRSGKEKKRKEKRLGREEKKKEHRQLPSPPYHFSPLLLSSPPTTSNHLISPSRHSPTPNPPPHTKQEFLRTPLRLKTTCIVKPSPVQHRHAPSSPSPSPAHTSFATTGGSFEGTQTESRWCGRGRGETETGAPAHLWGCLCRHCGGPRLSHTRLGWVWDSGWFGVGGLGVGEGKKERKRKLASVGSVCVYI